jgi:hypothetical protein
MVMDASIVWCRPTKSLNFVDQKELTETGSLPTLMTVQEPIPAEKEHKTMM